MAAVTDRQLHVTGHCNFLDGQQCGTVYGSCQAWKIRCHASRGTLLVCSFDTMTTKLHFKRAQLEKTKKQPDPRQKAPALEKAIQSCSQGVLEMVSLLLLHVWTLAHCKHSYGDSAIVVPCSFTLPVN